MSANVSKVEKEKEFGKDLGLIQEAIVTGRNVGATREFWAKLAHEADWFMQVVDVLEGRAIFRHDNHVVLDDHLPAVGKMKTVAHSQYGTGPWDEMNIELMKTHVSDRKFLNYNFLEYLFSRKYLIPDEWIGKFVIFSGTVFRNFEWGEDREKWYGLIVPQKKSETRKSTIRTTEQLPDHAFFASIM
jgi:hypothetical protein